MNKPDWGEVRNAYITGKDSLQKLAEKYGIPLRTIKDRSKREEWVEQRRNFRTKVALNTSQKTAKKEVKRLEKLWDATEDMAELIRQDIERMKTQRGKRKTVTTDDVKMIKDLTVALKNIAEVMRNVYDIPTIRERLLQLKYEDYKKLLAEMEKGSGEGLIALTEVLSAKEEEDGEMDRQHRGTEKTEEGDMGAAAKAD